MISNFVLVGQVGYIKKLENGFYSTIVYLNKYHKNKPGKQWSLPIECITKFKPKAVSGNSVLVEGEFVPSDRNSEEIEFRAKHIGVL